MHAKHSASKKQHVVLCQKAAPEKVKPTGLFSKRSQLESLTRTQRDSSMFSKFLQLCFLPFLCLLLSTMSQSRQQPWIDWRKSKAKTLILFDLEHGIIPLNEEEAPAETLWNDCCINMPEMIGVAFEQFKARLKDHRCQVKMKKEHQGDQLDMLKRDRELVGVRKHDKRGNVKFCLTPACELLQEDVKNEKHKEMSTEDLFLSRNEHHGFRDRDGKPFSLDCFAARVKQEEAAQKFHCCNQCKQAKKKKKEEDDENSGHWVWHSFNAMTTALTC